MALCFVSCCVYARRDWGVRSREKMYLVILGSGAGLKSFTIIIVAVAVVVVMTISQFVLECKQKRVELF